MRLTRKITYVFSLAIVILVPASAFPISISTSKATGARPNPILSATVSSRRWNNDSQTPSDDPQVFCRSESEAPIYTGKRPA
ncbi:hypothetical protein F5Y13DRAFT_43355 [Hypoxylon sp. FL1857]|nr:hypothetical protein F5Y13DRAFT_43355 [Hypoxylon sp. FL1857]